MLIGVWHDESVAVLSCRGRLDLRAAPALETAIDDALDGGRSKIVVDLSTTTSIDSSGLGALLSGLKKARLTAGDLRIAGAGQEVRTVINLSNLDRLLLHHATVEDALSGW